MSQGAFQQVFSHHSPTLCQQQQFGGLKPHPCATLPEYLYMSFLQCSQLFYIPCVLLFVSCFQCVTTWHVQKMNWFPEAYLYSICYYWHMHGANSRPFICLHSPHDLTLRLIHLSWSFYILHHIKQICGKISHLSTHPSMKYYIFLSEL